MARRVEVLATAVDVDSYRVGEPGGSDPVIGWSGTSSGFSYLALVEAPLRRLLRRAT